MVEKEKLDRALYIAALHSIRVNQFEPFNISVKKAGSLNAISQRLETGHLETGWLYVITTITAYEEGAGTPQIKVGLRDGETDFIFESGTVGNAEDTVEYVGQLMAKETDRIFALFEGATITDTVYLFVNGYKIKR